MSKHTKGPWFRDKYGAIKAMGETLRVNGVSMPCGARPSDFEEVEANSNLIAAAPELLEALKALTNSLDEHDLLHDDQRAAFVASVKAIAKATGSAA